MRQVKLVSVISLLLIAIISCDMAQTQRLPILGNKRYEVVEEAVEAIELPPGYSFKWDGEKGSSEEANDNLTSVIPLGFGAMILVTIVLFNALRQPLVI